MVDTKYPTTRAFASIVSSVESPQLRGSDASRFPVVFPGTRVNRLNIYSTLLTEPIVTITPSIYSTLIAEPIVTSTPSIYSTLIAEPIVTTPLATALTYFTVANFYSSNISTDQVTEGYATRDSIVKEIIETRTGDNSFENNFNAQRLLKLKQEFSGKLIYLIKEQDIEFGFDTPADKLVRECIVESELATKEWLNELFILNFGDVVITVGLLKIISHLDYHLAMPQGQTMALAALANRNAEIREAGIRAYENWGNNESLQILGKVECHEKWLNDYLMQVIEDLSMELS